MADAGAPENPVSPDDPRSNAASSDPNDIVPLGAWARALLVLLHLLPKNAISRMAGRFASLRWPAPVQRFETRLFARLVGANLDEAAGPVESYASLQQFFTRELRDGARPIQGDSMSVVAPCDGAWGESGGIRGGTLIQAKGRHYSVEELLGDSVRAGIYDGGTFATFYLSPRDYHRFHTPVAGRITEVDYWPGALWPVNAVGIRGVDRLFARNERLCAYLRADALTSGGEADPLALVAVGATMVGSVRLRFDALRTNRAGAARERREYADRAPKFARGEEWGHFEFGSTIVLLAPPGRFEIDCQPLGSALTLGEVIGRRRD